MREFACVTDVVACPEIEIVVYGLAPELDIVASGTSPVAKQRVFGLCFFVRVFCNVVDIVFCVVACNLDRHFFTDILDTASRITPGAIPGNPVSVDSRILGTNCRCVFPKFHARILDVGVNIVRLGILLQDDAIELSHAAKAENKEWRVADAFRMEVDVPVFIVAGEIQVRNRHVFRAFAVLALGLVFENFGQ